ncbi:alkaline phosphatase family protein [Nocardioides aurantiacus]|uniref:Type I phosphodiesterase/nucleotide pyrophosphatase n=1 Tax=Nocardioides aurantiacus TaxID=86796 RepID=A0A3N2CV67_9ACTN|nr:nucleotide pyrophosphatase/phosphodiesterase family protein [Nocardioides aurantiacus]ROR91366.1 type I phosphodiesterase/nucleotide pyrophosphatase [Nocardioides aurantiacus]
MPAPFGPVPADTDFVEPDLSGGGRTLADVLPAVSRALGVDAGLPTGGLELPPAPAYVVMLVDGLGHRLLAEHRAQAPFLHSLLGEAPVTCGVPSTTATSLTSLGTALPAGQHGLVGFTSRVPESGELLNALFWDQPVEPTVWQPHATAFDRLGAAGVHTTVVSKRDFAGSGLTRAGQRGASYVGADDVAERVAGAVAAAARRPSVTYVYDGDLDWHGHRAGVDSQRWRHQLRDIDEDAQELRDALPTDVRLVVVADHGMVDTTPATSLDLDALPGLRDGVTLLGGEARFRHVYCHAGALDDVAATWREQLAGRATVLTRDEAVARGWFGRVDAGVRLRIGDVVAAAHDDWALFSSVDFAYETRLVGLHGSLTAREMEIPLLVC